MSVGPIGLLLVGILLSHAADISPHIHLETGLEAPTTLDVVVIIVVLGLLLLSSSEFRSAMASPFYNRSSPNEPVFLHFDYVCRCVAPLESNIISQQEAQLLLGERATRKHAKDC